MRMIVIGMAALALAACEPTVPDSGAGVGFGDYRDYQRAQIERDRALAGGGTSPTTTTIQPPSGVQTAALDSDDPADIAARAQAAISNSGEQPVDASPDNAPPPVLNNPGISDEQDFGAVSDRESIASDRERIERNRELYTVVEPTALPSRTSTGPNIVDYALNTTNPRGSKVYSRSSIGAQSRYDRNCSKYASPDQAQSAFLSNGGPEKDRLGLDPDGDGFACTWDPAPFRAVRSN